MTKVQDVINALTTPAMPLGETVDQLLFGNEDTEVTGIATTFLATQKIIEQAKSLGANFIVSHEGIFYSHRAGMERLSGDPVYEDKRRMIEDCGMAIYRYHDYVHAVTPDVITAGLLRALGWQGYEAENRQITSILELPKTILQEVISHLGEALGVKHLRYIGEPTTPVCRVGVFVGYRGGGDKVISMVNEDRLDLVIYGEGPEWETSQYFRDAVQQGRPKALIVLGHGESEAPGMDYLAQDLRKKFPSVPVHFIPEEPLFRFV